MNVLLDFFGYVAGIVLIFIGITRLTKSVQDGPRGPGGIGTIMTFAAGGALLSFSPMISAFAVSLFDNPVTTTYGSLIYKLGLTAQEEDQANGVVAAIMKFLMVFGLVYFIRGIFIIRSVTEGHEQASMMAGVVCLLLGAVMVNLGPLLNAIQLTLCTDPGGGPPLCKGVIKFL
jgi:uncharacterized membrane protein HdeD (DUF308 family)